MRTVRALFLFLGSFVCVTAAQARQSGVLLGAAVSFAEEGSDTQDFATIHAPAYQSLWIARDAAGELKVLAVFPELIIPRSDGFCHVGIAQVCEFQENNESLRQVLWASPVAKAGEVEQSTACTPHKPDDYAGPYLRSEADKDKISQCGFELLNILYVSPEILSTSAYSGQSEDCEARGGRYTLDYRVRKFDSAQPASLSELLGPKAKAAFARALPKQGQGDGGEECAETNPDDDRGWRIAHKRGRWRPYVHQSLGYFGCAADAPLGLTLPTSLTGESPAAVDWKLLQSKMPGVADAYFSPAGDMLIAVSHSEVGFYELRAGVPGKLLLKLPAAGIVMTQWATGTHVHDWTEQLARLATQNLPPPVTRVKPAAP